MPFAWEFPDAETYARMLASTGPAYEAIQAVDEEEFHRYCVQLATQRVREGLPLRAEIACVGFTAQVPEATAKGSGAGAPTATRDGERDAQASEEPE